MNNNRPPIHVLIHGETGSGKSSFAATFPKPALVFLFDPFGKHLPYVRGGVPGPVESYKIGDKVQIKYMDIERPDGVIRVEFYHDWDIDNPTSYSYFRARMQVFQQEVDDWATIITDSVTFMELSARKLDEKVLNPVPPGVSRYAKGSGIDARQWYGASTDALEEMLCNRYAGLMMNVVVIAHTNKKKEITEGKSTQGAFAPGRLYDRSMLSAAYQEQYRCYTVRNDAGEREHYVQTQNRDGYAATTQIQAHDPSYPQYENIWYNWDKEQAEQIAKIKKGE